MNTNTKPKGKLLIIGGHEDKGAAPGENLNVHKKEKPQSHFEILGMLISKIPRINHVIEIIAAASSIGEEVEKLYIESFKREGFTEVGHIKVESREDADNPDSIRRIQEAHAVFFTGGDQAKLVSLIADTGMLQAISQKYHEDKHFIVAGTSAGAMAIPEVIITGGLVAAALYKGDLRMAGGLGLLTGVIVDTHFIKRGRFARLAQAIAINPSCLGIGLEENSALLIAEGDRMECVGSGMIILIDASKMGKTNSEEVDEETPIVIENLTVSILAEGSGYLLKERKHIAGKFAVSID